MEQTPAAESRWELKPSGCFIALVPGGLRLGLKRRGLETSFIPFEDVTHIEVTGFGVWIATRKTTLAVRRSHFLHLVHTHPDASALAEALPSWFPGGGSARAMDAGVYR